MLFSDSLNDDLSEDDLEVEDERLAMGTVTVPQGEDNERPSTSGETQLNENHQPGTSATPDQGQSRLARKRQPMKRKANFDVDKVMHSFQKMQEATLKAFTDAEKERVAQQLAVEERREKREEKNVCSSFLLRCLVQITLQMTMIVTVLVMSQFLMCLAAPRGSCTRSAGVSVSVH